MDHRRTIRHLPVLDPAQPSRRGEISSRLSQPLSSEPTAGRHPNRRDQPLSARSWRSPGRVPHPRRAGPQRPVRRPEPGTRGRGPSATPGRCRAIPAHAAPAPLPRCPSMPTTSVAGPEDDVPGGITATGVEDSTASRSTRQGALAVGDGSEPNTTSGAVAGCPVTDGRRSLGRWPFRGSAVRHRPWRGSPRPAVGCRGAP
jgi:hypothetical protein